MPPGGEVERGETPRRAAVRELKEETGLDGELLLVPAAVSVRSYHPDLPPTLGLSYAAVIDREIPLSGEHGQPAAWVDLEEERQSAFPDDRDRIRAYMRRLAVEHGVEAH